jgi:hypothetical protein
LTGDTIGAGEILSKTTYGWATKRGRLKSNLANKRRSDL